MKSLNKTETHFLIRPEFFDYKHNICDVYFTESLGAVEWIGEQNWV